MTHTSTSRLGRGCCLLALLLLVGHAHAAELTWVGGVGNWDTDAGWLPGSAEPTAIDDVEISNGTVSVTLPGEVANQLLLGLNGVGTTGTLNILSGGQLSTASGFIGSSAGLTGIASVDGAGSTWTNTGSLYISYSSTGTLNIQNGAVVTNTNGIVGRTAGWDGNVTVNGAGSTWNNTDALKVATFGNGTLTIQNNATVHANTGLTLGEGATGKGIVNLQGGTLDLHGSTLDKGHGLATFNFTGGTLKNVGTFNIAAALKQDGGTLAPGASAGVTQITGNYNLNAGTLAIELGGTTAGTGHDQVTVTGALNLGAPSVLDVSLINAFNPTGGSIFDILNFGSLTGGFGTINLPMLGAGLTWDTTKLYSDGLLAVAGSLTGDLNGDGFVGIADLNIVLGNWNQNIPPGNPLADPSGDNFVGIADLNIVLGNWNAGTPPGDGDAVVPEPTTIVPLLGLLHMCLARRSAATVPAA